MRGNPYVFANLGQGVNLEAAPYSLDLGQAKGAQNFHTSPAGAIVKRNGCITHAEPEEVLTSLFGVNLSSDIMIGAGGTKLYSVSTSAGIIKTLASGLTSGLNWEWIQAPASGGQGPVWGVNGTDKPMYWDGVSEAAHEWTASVGSIPNGKVIAYHDNRVYIASGSTLYWSDITDPRNFESPKGGSTKVDPEDGQEITALGKVGPYLMIFKSRKTFLLTDSNTGAIRRVSEDMGCVAPRTVIPTEVGTFFLTPDSEIVLTDGQSFQKKVSIPIKPLLKNLSGSIAQKACGIHTGDYVYFSISENGAINDTILEYNLTNDSWWPHAISYQEKPTEATSYGGVGNYGGEGIYGDTGRTSGGVNQFAILDPSNVATLYAAGSNPVLKRVFRCFVKDTYYDSEGLKFKAYWISPWHVFTYPHLVKNMREIRVDALGTYDLYTATSFSTELVREEGRAWEIADEETIFGEGEFGGSGTFGDVAAIIEKRFYTPGEGRAWSLKFESEDIQNLEIYSYTASINYKKD